MACKAVVAISHAGTLLVKEETTIGSGCTKCTCKHPKTTCATVVKADSPPDKPVAQTLLTQRSRHSTGRARRPGRKLGRTCRRLSTRLASAAHSA
jgi:hypothetical protein